MTRIEEKKERNVYFIPSSTNIRQEQGGSIEPVIKRNIKEH